MHAAIKRIENKHLIKVIMKQIVYKRAVKVTISREQLMNVEQYLANGHEGNIIQGSLSLDDESEAGCTVIVPEFQKHIKE